MSLLDPNMIGIIAVGLAVLTIFGLAMLLKAFGTVTDFLDKRDNQKITPIVEMIKTRDREIEGWMRRMEDMYRTSEERILGRVAEIANGRPTAVDFERLKGRVASLEELRKLSAEESDFPR